MWTGTSNLTQCLLTAILVVGAPLVSAQSNDVSPVQAQPGSACEKINSDPLVMSDGIAATDDPILLFRSPSYAYSFAKRLGGL